MIIINHIKQVISNYYNKPFEEMESNRKLENMIPKQIAIYLSKTITCKSPALIINYFNINRSAVYNSVKRIENLSANNNQIKDDIRNLKELILGENNGGGMKSKPPPQNLIQRTKLTEALFYTAC